MRTHRDPPNPGQRSVWDFTRPPAYEQWHERVEVRFAGRRIAGTDDAWCVLETSHPPTYYLPYAAFEPGTLRAVDGVGTVCEWKGAAAYYDVVCGDQVAARAAWTYPNPTGDALVLRDHVALYARAMDVCLVDGKPVTPQPGGFYGGWITDRVSGPFKGSPGTTGW
jgi:uncharacterized protein (DUF427 family)